MTAGIRAASILAALSLLASCPGKAKIEPVAIDEAIDACALCRMSVKGSGYAAELVRADGSSRKYDDVGCLLAQAADALDSADPAAFVQDRDDGAWVTLGAAFFALDEGVPTPMGFGIHAFAAAAGRAAFIAAHPGAVEVAGKGLAAIVARKSGVGDAMPAAPRALALGAGGKALIVGILGTGDDAPLLIGLEKGFFRAEGVEVGFEVYANEGELGKAAAAGAVDLALAGLPTAQAIVDGLGARVVSSLRFNEKARGRSLFVMAEGAPKPVKEALKPFFRGLKAGVEWTAFNPDGASALLVAAGKVGGDAGALSEEIQAGSWNISGTDARANLELLLGVDAAAKVLYKSPVSLSPADTLCHLVE